MLDLGNGPAAAAAAAAEIGDARSIPMPGKKLAGAKPYDCVLLGLTDQDVVLLPKIVPSAVSSTFDMNRTFEQQDPKLQARAILHLERQAPALRRAEKHWAARSLLASTSHNLRATAKKTQKRRALAALKAEDERAERRKAINNDVGESASAADTDDLAFYLLYKCPRTSL